MLYVAFALMLLFWYLGYRAAKGWLGRFGARWWNGLIAGILGFLIYLMGYLIFDSVGGEIWIARIGWWVMLYMIASVYGQIKNKREQNSASAE